MRKLLWKNRIFLTLGTLILGIFTFVWTVYSQSQTNPPSPPNPPSSPNTSNGNTEQNQESNNSGPSVQIKNERGNITIINNENNSSPLPSPGASPSTPSSPNLPVKDPINTFKKLLLGWYEKLDEFEQKTASNVDKTSWEKLKNLSPDLENSIREIERLLKSQNLSDNQQRIATFYVKYWLDFKTRVFERSKNSIECVRASSLYSDSIDLYLDFFKNGGEIQTEEEFFIIIELAHFLANRDGGGYDISKADRPKLAKGFDTALKLLKNLEKNLENFNNLKGDFYATRGVISFNSTSYKSAIDDFEKAITFGNESIELKYNLASAYFLNGKYDKAIERYEKVANSQNKKINPNSLNRDLGFAYLLRGYEQHRENNISGAKLLFNKSKTAFDAIIKTEFSEHNDIAIAGKATAVYLLEKDDLDAREKLMPIIDTDIAQETKRIWGDLDNRIGLSRLIGLKKGIAGTYITHDEIATKKGDLFEIFHDNFYCPSGAMRKNHRSN
ncbi:MAG: hypothetical protein F6K48_27460 [Okeania sp. SIO3H1]|nr:hypothetical protein [Okeania sp. SIO3H1]